MQSLPRACHFGAEFPHTAHVTPTSRHLCIHHSQHRINGSSTRSDRSICTVKCKAASQGSRKKRRSNVVNPAPDVTAFKGFGAGPKEKSNNKEIESEEIGDTTQPGDSIQRALADRDYLPERWISQSVRLTTTGPEATWEAATAIEPLQPLMILTPAAYVQRPTQQEPEPEEAAAAAADLGLTVQQRRALRTLPCTVEGWSRLPVTLANMDIESTQAVREDASTAELEQETLAQLFRRNGHSDGCQDLAFTMSRQELPTSFMGIWPEQALMDHSCVANTNTMVVQDRMIIRAVAPIAAGETLTTNHIAEVVMQPLEQRQQALMLRGRPACRCRRCQVEASLPSNVTGAMMTFNEAGAAVMQALRSGAGSEAQAAGRQLLEAGASCYTALRESLPSPKDRALVEPSLYLALQGRLLHTDLVEQNLDIRPLEACLNALEVSMNGSEQHVMLGMEMLRRVELLSRSEEARSKRGVLGQLIQKAQGTSVRIVHQRYGIMSEGSFERILRALLVGGQMGGGADGDSMSAVAAGMGFQEGDSAPFTEHELESLFEEEEGEGAEGDGSINLDDMGLENVMDLDDVLREAQGYQEAGGEFGFAEEFGLNVDASQAVIDVDVVGGEENVASKKSSLFDADLDDGLLDEVLKQLDNDQFDLLSGK